MSRDTKRLLFLDSQLRPKSCRRPKRRIWCNADFPHDNAASGGRFPFPQCDVQADWSDPPAPPVYSSITCMGSLSSNIGLSTTFNKCWTSHESAFSNILRLWAGQRRGIHHKPKKSELSRGGTGTVFTS